MSGPQAPQPGPMRLPDAPPRNLAERLAPAAALPYVQLARLDRPIGWQLLLAPCWWGSALASVAGREAPNLLHLALFLIGAVAMRGAGSTYNDIVDRHIDARVERTRGRPLPSGRASLSGAWAFLALQALVGLAVVLAFERFTIAVALASLVIVAAYPFAKRVTSWPQAVLGLAFAWGALVGWAAGRGALAAPAFLLYAAAVAWTIGYDTIYAVQDRRDDPAAGVRSTARLFGARVREGVSLLYLVTVTLAFAALWSAGAGVASWAGLTAMALHLVWQTRTLGKNQDPATALRLFRANRDAGLLFFAGLFVDALARAL